MLEIYVARHGQDQDNENGILNGRRNKSLTDIGIKQAKDLANKIKDTGLFFDEVYSSPLNRASFSAKIICDVLDILGPVILMDLIERDFGIMTGIHLSNIKKNCSPHILETSTITYFLSPSGGETFPRLLMRARKLLRHLHKKHKDGKILLVCHGDIGKMIYAGYYNLNWKDVLSDFHFGNSDILVLSRTSSPGDAHLFKAEQYNL